MYTQLAGNDGFWHPWQQHMGAGTTEGQRQFSGRENAFAQRLMNDHLLYRTRHQIRSSQRTTNGAGVVSGNTSTSRRTSR